MTEKNNFPILYCENTKADSVVSFPQGITFKIGQLLEKVNAYFRQKTLYELPENFSKEGLSKLRINGTQGFTAEDWNQHGMEAEILNPESGGWKKGKVRIRVVLEFCPDESEIVDNENQRKDNSLDCIRQNIS